MRHHRTLLLIAFTATVLMMPQAARGQDFYQRQLAAGRQAVAAGRHALAVDLFRIAAFGFLDRPQLLTEALIRQALAASMTGSSEELDRAVARFLEVERRFGAYPSAALEPETREQSDALLLRAVPAPMLASYPTLQSLAPKPKEERPSRRRVRAEPSRAPLTASLEPAPAPVNHVARARSFVAAENYAAALKEFDLVTDGELAADEALRGDLLVALVRTENWARADAMLPSVSDAQLRRRNVSAARRDLLRWRSQNASSEPAAPVARDASEIDAALSEARQQIQDGRAREAVATLQRVRGAAGRRDVRLTLLEAAALVEDWQTARAQIDALKPFRTGEEAAMFYGAVVLYELGQMAEAKTLLADARQKIQRNPYVDYYTERIDRAKAN
jgi:hypothetical protein